MGHHTRRVAMISFHTSPLHQPGTGDAGGMNVYLANVARQLARSGTEVEIFTRATHSTDPTCVELEPGVHVRHIPAGPFERDNKVELIEHLCTFIGNSLRSELTCTASSGFDVVHSHYWLSGHVGVAMRRRWGVPVVHTAHTLGRVKNMTGEGCEPPARISGEETLVREADALIANTAYEAEHLRELYAAAPGKVHVASPGADLEVFRPDDTGLSRDMLGVDSDEVVLAFVGRLQAAKGPDVLVRAVAHLAEDPDLRKRLRVVMCGGSSGAELQEGGSREELRDLALESGVQDLIEFWDPLPPEQLAHLYRAADFTVVPSRAESFGLVSVESAACGTPVIAADVDGLRTSVADGVSGVLVEGHTPLRYADALRTLLDHPDRYAALTAGAVQHASQFSWESTAQRVSQVYDHVTAS